MSNGLVIVIKGAISECPKVEQEHIAHVYLRMKALVEDNGNAGLMALALLGAESSGGE